MSPPSRTKVLSGPGVVRARPHIWPRQWPGVSIAVVSKEAYKRKLPTKEIERAVAEEVVGSEPADLDRLVEFDFSQLAPRDCLRINR